MNISKLFKSSIVGPLAAFIIIFIISAVASPRFLDANNLSNLILQVSVVSIVSIGATLVILTGGIDISSGSAIALLTMLTAVFIKNFHMPIWAAMVAVIIIGTIMGIYNGVLVAYLRIPAFIATLASMGIFRGFSFMMNNGAPLQSISDDLEPIFYGRIFGLPIVLIYILIFYVFAHIFMKYTQTGRRIYAIGGNSVASRLSGIHVKKVTLTTYAFAGLFASFAAILMACRLNSGSQNYGVGMEMSAIAATVIGGVSLAGGKGNVVCTFIGALTIVVVQNILNLNAVQTAVQQIAIGIIIMLAVFIDMWRSDFSAFISRIARSKVK